MSRKIKVVHTGVSDQSDYLMVPDRRAVLDIGVLFHAGGLPGHGPWRVELDRTPVVPENLDPFLGKDPEFEICKTWLVEHGGRALFVSGYPVRDGQICCVPQPPGHFLWEDAEGFVLPDWTHQWLVRLNETEPDEYHDQISSGARSRFNVLRSPTSSNRSDD